MDKVHPLGEIISHRKSLPFRVFRVFRGSDRFFQVHRWLWRVMIAMVTLLAVAQDTTPPPPLTPPQLNRVRDLVHLTRTQSATLQARLSECQRELARVYAHYKLDEARAQQLQREIVELQRQLLANHHRLQVELRTLVNRERFETLRQRLEQADAKAASSAEKPSASTSPTRTL